MTELERQLSAVAAEVEWPRERDLRARVRARVEEPSQPLLPWRRTLVLALALLALAIGVAFAVPPARSAILRWFGLEHVRVVHVEELPPTRRVAASDLGDRTSVAEAQRRVGFRLRRLPGRAPDSVYIRPVSNGFRVTLVYGSVERPRLLLGEFRGTGTDEYVEKYVASGTKVERVRVDGNPGIWFSGAPHALLYMDPEYPRQVYTDVALLAGNTLVWQDGAVTFRLEAKLTKRDALGLAKLVR